MASKSTNSNNSGSQPTRLVGCLASAFRKVVTMSDDIEEAKQLHRANLKILTDKYMADVQSGKADGIRNAKELVEVIKADMLLMGEATERVEDNADVARVKEISAQINMDDPAVLKIISDLFDGMNSINNSYGDQDSIVEYHDYSEEDDIEYQEATEETIGDEVNEESTYAGNTSSNLEEYLEEEADN